MNLAQAGLLALFLIGLYVLAGGDDDDDPQHPSPVTEFDAFDALEPA